MRAFVIPAAALLSCAPLVTSAAPAQDELAARNLAATCANCHGTDGFAQGGEIKSLAGMPAERLLALMADFRSGAEPATVMHQIARGYSDAQLRLIANYFAARKAAR